jgi:hypothetical protein
MIDLEFAPDAYFAFGQEPIAPLVHLKYPESTWGDEITIEVYQDPSGSYTFEAVDFYGNNYILNPESSDKPLTIGQVIKMIEGISLDDADQSANMSLTLIGIPEAESVYYPKLATYFNEKRIRLGLD